MGRRKLKRLKVLYTRINKENLDFINEVCASSKLSKTAFIDMHINFLRNSYNIKKVASQIAKEA